MCAVMMKKVKRTVHRIVSIPDSLAIRSYREIHGFLSAREALGLFQTARRVPEGGTVVEIGSWKGKSTFCLAKGLRGGRVIAIDPFNAEGESGSAEIYEQTRGEGTLEEQFRRNMEERGVMGKIEMWKGYSGDFVARLPGLGGIDVLFIDGDHSKEGCLFDFENFSPWVKRGGYVLFHDFDKERLELGPTWVINNKVRTSSAWAWSACFDSLWIARRVG